MGFKLDLWDYVTFVAIIAALGSVVVILLWIAGLPGKIAIARKHPHAEAVKIMGYAGFLAIVPWIQAFIWAFKPTEAVDIRRFPAEEARAIEEENARLTEETDAAEEAKVPPKGKPRSDSDTTG